MEKFTLEKERILEAAKTCSQAKEVLKALFPQAFEQTYPELKHTTFYVIPRLSTGVYRLVKNEGEYNFVNISGGGWACRWYKSKELLSEYLHKKYGIKAIDDEEAIAIFKRTANRVTY